MANEITTQNSDARMLMDPVYFEQLQRIGGMLASSVFFPDHLRKGDAHSAKANGALVANMAMRLNEDPLIVAQNIYFVGGKPGWNTTYLIAKANQHGVFDGGIDWEIEGKGADLSVTAFATKSSNGQRVQYTCDMAMAGAEGWTKSAKYKSIPELMLRYRSAAALIRLYCPEVMVGIPSGVEVETNSEMRDITPQEPPKKAAPKAKEAEKPAEAEPVAEDVVDAEVVEDKPEPEQPQPDQNAEAEKPNEDAEPEPEKAAQNQDSEATQQRHKNILSSFLTDLKEAPSVDAVESFYRDQLDAMKAEAPELYAQAKAAIEEARKS